MHRAACFVPLLLFLACLPTCHCFPFLQRFSVGPGHESPGIPRLSFQVIRHSFERIFGLSKDRYESEASELSRAIAPHGTPPPAYFLDEVVLRFNISNSDERSSLAEASDTLLLDVWQYSRDFVDIRTTLEAIPSLLGLLPGSLQHAHFQLMDARALRRAILRSYPSQIAPDSLGRSTRQRGTLAASTGPMCGVAENAFFEEYRSLPVMEQWMLLLESLNPSWVSMTRLGKSYEGRDILGLQIGIRASDADSGKRRKMIVVMGGAHAREWISTSTVNFIAYSLIRSFGKDSEATKLIHEFDWVFIPSVNPDGYAYTWDVDRLWRKNRQPTSLRFCRGLDLDRAWEYKWDGRNSGNPCSGSYAGERPFEAVEASRIASWAKDQVENNNVDIVGFLDLHSYSQQILYPYSYSCVDEPPTLEDLEELGEGLAKAFRLRHYHYYTVIPACEGNVVFDPQSSDNVVPLTEGNGGSALDYFYRAMGVRHSFQIKLRDTGSYGFLLPKEYIIPTGEETFEAMKYFGKSLHDDGLKDPYHGGYLRDMTTAADDGSTQQPLT